ncbi:MAG: transcription termination factor Rho [Candidatus Shikimatogenerans sp. Tder]|uniref:Transcription termination factor Rho n=1 Tax=Candidatus Shikimatogenerans sp. Tder TaxID=3158566 RepID=A0AAU7QTB8_9FLAO
MNINNIKIISNNKLLTIIKKLKIKIKYSESKIELINYIRKYIKKKNNLSLKRKYKNIINGGVLEISLDNYGFLRSSNFNYLESYEDIYISKKLIFKYNLKNGDIITGEVSNNEKSYFLIDIKTINGIDIKKFKNRKCFKNLTPIFPNERLILSSKGSNISTKIIDIFTPIGKGQRSLIVAPPKAGKTQLLKDCSLCISKNYPNIYQIFLLIDERPEEVTDIKRSVKSEVIYSTFDEDIKNHIKTSKLVLEKSLRLVECGYDVIIFLDSITRLTRAYNIYNPNSGKVLSGGIDTNALLAPKKFFGSARNIENGGSLTIIATAIIDTGSKMDDIIYEEFKGTGNMELQLDRKLANKRIFPSINFVNSGTRRDEFLYKKKFFKKILNFRKHIYNMSNYKSIKYVINKFKKVKKKKKINKFII